MLKRTEKDLIGEKEIPNECYYGVHTQRALENFPISGIPTSKFPIFIKSYAQIKKAAALANKELKMVDEKIAKAIITACDKIIAGEFHNQFVVDVIQGGAGTSMNMNMNEVIANVALEVLGKAKGEYTVISPNDHVNKQQSTNDTYPSAVKVSVYYTIDNLIAEMQKCIKSLSKKADEFKDVVKIGRTQLQDAVPMTLGQSFANYACQLESSIKSLQGTRSAILGLNMGATAIGTGITCHPKYKKIIAKYLKEVIGDNFYVMENLFTATQDASGFALVSGGLKRLAIQLSKICNDLRLLSSGPRAGLGEINLLPMQAGSSIMPGKVNPVIAEVVNQVCFQVIGYDVAIAFAAEGGQLELNAFEPLMAFNLLHGASMLKNGLETLRLRLIDGISANVEKCLAQAENNIGIVTALNPYIGYKKSTEIAKKCLAENKSVMQVALEMQVMNEADLKKALNLKDMVDIYK